MGEATLCAVYPDARNQFAHPELAAEGLDEHAVSEVWLAGSPTLNTWIDVTDFFERKLEALSCHGSQISHHDPESFGHRLRTWGAAQASAGGLPKGRMAEGFQRISTG